MYYNADTAALELSVRELCAMAHKGGHLDTRFPHRIIEALQKGGEIHRKLQATEAPGYQSEVPLCNTTLFGDIYYTVSGRADGIFEENGLLTVEEIKTTRGTGAQYGVREDAYSQLRCYAHFLCEARHLTRIRMRMRVTDPDGGNIRDSYSEASAAELRDFYLTLLTRVRPFAEFEAVRRTALLPAVSEVRFPYAHPRAGQTEFAENCFRAIRKGQRLFAEAPTGIGKTMSALYPAVKALGEGMIDRVFYLTARASARREAYRAAGRLFSAGARLRTVILYAKEQMCLLETGPSTHGESHCNPVDCPYARGYFDRVDRAVLELLNRQNGFPRQILLEVARKYGICPYELSLDLSLWCEIIICDYNYAFDPAVYLRRYFDAGDGERGRYTFLIDEAHNLPDRARDMYSARLDLEPFEQVYARLSPDGEESAEAALGGFLIAFRRLARLCTENRVRHEDGTESGYYLNRAPLERFVKEADGARQKLDAFLKKNAGHPLAGPLDDLITALRRFAGIGDYYDGRYLTYIELQHGALSIEEICLDPAGVLSACLSRAASAIFFSATLTPPSYFAEILGGGKQAVSISLPSPYDPRHLCVTAVTGVSTRMEDRPASYKKISTLIAATVSAKAGNYMVYFPSYDYLENVFQAFHAKYPRVTAVVQQRGMSHSERETFLDAFPEDEGVLRVGFCVLGGSFSEGVDLPGSRLIGAVIVGVGIPGLSNERNMLRDYYENKCEQGYDYAYTYPGMNRVLQAAGRVIRRESDRGVVVLIDSRYGEEPYLHLYPPHWKNLCAAGSAAALARRLQDFWQGADNKNFNK